MPIVLLFIAVFSAGLHTILGIGLGVVTVVYSHEGLLLTDPSAIVWVCGIVIFLFYFFSVCSIFNDFHFMYRNVPMMKYFYPINAFFGGIWILLLYTVYAHQICEEIVLQMLWALSSIYIFWYLMTRRRYYQNQEFNRVA